MILQSGIDALLQSPPSWKKSRIGLVTNEAAKTNTGIASRQALAENGFGLVTLFSPEHGLNMNGPDGHKMPDGSDPLTRLPVVSLYSDKLAPDEADLSQVDLILFDIPDIGCRFYTYLWTLTHVMEACAKYRKPLVVLDRPNPISGLLEKAEGPILAASEASFIGRWPVPIRHSATLGELALYFNASRQLGLSLEVIRCRGWNREMYQPDWALPFVPTSPAIQNFAAMLLYPGICLLEATNLSEGRGSAFSFTAIAAPWLQPEPLAAALRHISLDTIQARPVQFTPDNPHAKFCGQACRGVQLIPEAGYELSPVLFGLHAIRLIKDSYPDDFRWQPYPTLVNPDGTGHLEKLLGQPGMTALFSLPLAKFHAQVAGLTRCKQWENTISPYLLY